MAGSPFTFQSIALLMFTLHTRQQKVKPISNLLSFSVVEQIIASKNRFSLYILHSNSPLFYCVLSDSVFIRHTSRFSKNVPPSRAAHSTFQKSPAGFHRDSGERGILYFWPRRVRGQNVLTLQQGEKPIVEKTAVFSTVSDIRISAGPWGSGSWPGRSPPSHRPQCSRRW